MTNNQDPLRIAREALEQAEESLDQILDDMREGLSVCRATKDEATLALDAARQALAKLDQLAANESPDDDLVEVVARKVAPFVCRPVYNGDNDDVAAGISHAYYVAREVLSALDMLTRLQAAKDAGREEAAATMEDLGFFTDIDELVHMTKQQMSERTCHEGAKAIRERIGKP